MAIAGPVSAQVAANDSTAPWSALDSIFAHGTATGFALGLVGLPGADASLWLAGFQVTQLRGQNAAGEFTLYVSPQAMRAGVLALSPKFSLVSLKPVRNGKLIVKAGLWAALVAGDGGMGMLPGLQTGIGMLLPSGSKTALRFEVQPHSLLAAPMTPALVISIGIASLKRTTPRQWTGSWRESDSGWPR
jgi:hypothetical protein